jgi:outer membrane protein assembly factor BamB
VTRIVLVQELLLVGVEANALVAIDRGTGTVRLQSRLPSTPRFLTAADSDVFLTAEDGVLYAYAVENEIRQSWKHPRIRTRGLGNPAVDEDRIYVTLVDNTLRAFSRDGGSQKWSHDLPTRPAAGPMVSAGSVLVALTNGMVAQASVETGARVEGTSVPSNTRARLHAVASPADGSALFGLVTGDNRISEIVAWRFKN